MSATGISESLSKPADMQKDIDLCHHIFLPFQSNVERDLTPSLTVIMTSATTA